MKKKLRHELRDKSNKIEYLMKKFPNKKNIKYLVVTKRQFDGFNTLSKKSK